MVFASSASAFEDDEEEYEPRPGEEVVIGIFGQIIGNAIEKKQEKQCAKWYDRCEDGNDHACDRYESKCD